MIARAVMVIFAPVFGTLPAAARMPYDGDGKVSGAADISGSVRRNGVVRASLRGAFANGQLSDHIGSGKWNAASAGMPCSGQWMATRQ